MRPKADRTAQDQRGEIGNGKAGFEPNAADRPAIDAEAVAARRLGMLQRFMRAADIILAHVPGFTRRRSRSKGKGKSAGGRAVQLRKAQNRTAKQEARLRHLARPGVTMPTRDRRPLNRPPNAPGHQP